MIMSSIYTGAEYSTQTLFREVERIAKEERIEDFAAYKSLVDDIIEEKRMLGFFDSEEDMPQIKENLMARWPQVERCLSRVQSGPRAME